MSEWQSKNPGYKTRQRRKKFLKDEKNQKKVEKDNVLRDLILTQICDRLNVLRDLVMWQIPVLKGLIASVFGVLRDEIYIVECRLYDRGSELMGMVSRADE